VKPRFKVDFGDRLKSTLYQINLISRFYSITRLNRISRGRFRDSFGLKKAKIKKRKIPDVKSLSVDPIDSVLKFLV